MGMAKYQSNIVISISQSPWMIRVTPKLPSQDLLASSFKYSRDSDHCLSFLTQKTCLCTSSFFYKSRPHRDAKTYSGSLRSRSFVFKFSLWKSVLENTKQRSYSLPMSHISRNFHKYSPPRRVNKPSYLKDASSDCVVVTDNAVKYSPYFDSRSNILSRCLVFDGVFFTIWRSAQIVHYLILY
jgi:hypothetical protein